MVQTKNKCRFCNSDELSLIIDFGDVALAGGFIISEQFQLEKKYPLQLYFCQNCYLLQIINRIEPEILFREYFYYSSAIGTLRNHFKQYAKEVTSRFVEPSESTVIEIGCNDGVLLNPLHDIGVDTLIGVDPSKNVVNSIDNPAITVVNDFFTYDTAVALRRI